MSDHRRRLPHFRLDFRSDRPVYWQIVRQVQRLTATGGLRPGDQLPTVRELAAQLGVNFNTVARAYRLLHTRRVVSAQRGRGTFVLDTPPSRRAHIATLQLLASEYIDEARQHKFRDAQIAAAVTARLRSRPAGDNHG